MYIASNFGHLVHREKDPNTFCIYPVFQLTFDWKIHKSCVYLLNTNYTISFIIYNFYYVLTSRTSPGMYVLLFIIWYLLLFRSYPSFLWVKVPSCINITDLTCYIFPVFNDVDYVFRDLKVSVRAQDNAGNVGTPVNITFNPLTAGKWKKKDNMSLLSRILMTIMRACGCLI